MKNHILRVMLLAGACLAFCATSFGQEEQAFTIPVPEGSRLADTYSMPLGKLQIESSLYFAEQPAAKVIAFYRQHFAKAGFSIIQDSQEGLKKLLRFQKDSQVAALAITPQGPRTKIVAAHYLQPFGTPSPEQTKPFWKDLINSLPRQEKPGMEIKSVPRPPQSLRLAGGKFMDVSLVFYRSQVPVEEIMEFYKLGMPDLGWLPGQVYDMEKTVQDFRSESQAKIGQVTLPFPDITFDQLVSGGMVLIYAQEDKEAQITIFNAFGDNQSALVLIYYVEKKKSS